ncbi:MAG: TMEM43 family protein [Planctomycetes bacterium]|nr:TMEM43 family protein [Planctomycetota bacterium]MCH9724026.1 TMEM43 family protein [Planctomycetota bacterium]MCH9778082.1 TMEM43 family protein [Planctomycetota bacterium]MDF1744037.1 TMEM43 family protein [Gimesia sp.]
MMTQNTDDNSENHFRNRLKIALKNLGIGMVFIIAGLFLLWHNETNNLERERIAQAQSVLAENQENASEKNSENATESVVTITMFNWGFRISGWIILFLGLATLFKPLVVLVDKIPLLGNFVGRGITVFAILSSFSLSFLMVSAIWMVTKPVYGAVMLLAGIIPLLLLYRSGRRARLKRAYKQA